MRVGIAADHGGFALKGKAAETLRAAGHEVVDFGVHQRNLTNDYPWRGASPQGRLSAGWRFAAAALARPSPRTKLPAFAPV